MAGGLAANVKADWSTAQWFTESAGGLLVTTADADAGAFEATVGSARRIGTVTDTDTLSMDGEAVSLAALLKAYRSEESGEINR